jgi:hypothetical protein
MNKAFVREPDNSQPLCPRCGSVGVAVGPVTLAAHCDDPTRRRISESAFFCPAPGCKVAYFDSFERTVPCTALLASVYPKDPQAPVCACFGLTCDDIDQDLHEGTPVRVRRLLEKARSPEARCQSLSATGQSCIAEVQKYYMRGLNQRHER